MIFKIYYNVGWMVLSALHPSVTPLKRVCAIYYCYGREVHNKTLLHCPQLSLSPNAFPLRAELVP